MLKALLQPGKIIEFVEIQGTHGITVGIYNRLGRAIQKKASEKKAIFESKSLTRAFLIPTQFQLSPKLVNPPDPFPCRR